MNMQEAVLQLTARLEHAIWILGLLTSVLVLCFLCLALLLGMLMWRRADRRASSFDAERADMLFEQGKFEALLDLCEHHAKLFPFSVEAHWYIGLARYNCGDYSRAMWAFDRVQCINPSWRQDVAAYLSAIQHQGGSFPEPSAGAALN